MAGCVAGAIFALTPLVSESASQLGVDLPELAFLLGAVLLLQRGHDRRDWRAFDLAGLLAGIALQVRPTAFAALPVLAFAAWRARAPHALPAFLVGGALPSLVEAACYAAAAGDPLLGWRLSLGHGRIPSSELPASVDVRRSPLFNPAFIAGWKRPLGIHVHWAVDSLINYLLHPAVALTLGAAAALLALERRLLRGSDQAARLLRAALALARCWFVVLTYALAIDPKPRMFLPVLAAAAAVSGVALTRRARTGRLLVVAVTALIAGKGVLALAARTDTRALQLAGPSVIATTPGLAIDPRTAQYLALVPAARALPPADPLSSAGPVLLVGLDDCARAAAAERYRGWRVGKRIDPSPPASGPVATLQRAGVFADRAPRPLLCTLTPWPGAGRAAPPPR